MSNRVTSDEIAAGIGKFAFRAILGFALMSAFLQYWVIAVPLLIIALIIASAVIGVRDSLREYGPILTLIYAAGSGCFYYGLWLYFVGDDKFASDKWHFIVPVCAIAGIIAFIKNERDEWESKRAIRELRQREDEERHGR